MSVGYYKKRASYFGLFFHPCVANKIFYLLQHPAELTTSPPHIIEDDRFSALGFLPFVTAARKLHEACIQAYLLQTNPHHLTAGGSRRPGQDDPFDPGPDASPQARFGSELAGQTSIRVFDANGVRPSRTMFVEPNVSGSTTIIRGRLLRAKDAHTPSNRTTCQDPGGLAHVRLRSKAGQGNNRGFLGVLYLLSFWGISLRVEHPCKFLMGL